MNAPRQVSQNYTQALTLCAGQMAFVCLLCLFAFTGGCGNASSVKVEYLVKKSGVVYLKTSNLPFSGKVTASYADGKKRFEASYINGREDGPCAIWHQNGRLMHQAVYKKGRYDGVSYWWNEEGKIAATTTHRSGKEIARVVVGALDIKPDILPVIQEHR